MKREDIEKKAQSAAAIIGGIQSMEIIQASMLDHKPEFKDIAIMNGRVIRQGSEVVVQSIDMVVREEIAEMVAENEKLWATIGMLTDSLGGGN